MKAKLLISVILLSLFTGFISGQKAGKKIIVKGTVTDVNAVPVDHAVIFVDKMQTNYLTDPEGRYRIRVPAEAKTITVYSQVSGSGEGAVGSSKRLDITLRPSAGNPVIAGFVPGDNETVNVGYGRVNKNTSTAAVKERDVSKPKFSAYTNMADLIRAEYPSARVSGSSIILQGVSTYSGSNEALIVVDGIVVDSIDSVHPGDVKSVSILTGANASVYGMRGANGVVLITTLRGDDRR